MKAIFFFFLLCFCSCISKSDRHVFWNSEEAFIKQTPPTDIPRIFAPGLLVPDGGIALDRTAFSSDGKEFYYCTAERWYDAKGAKIRYFKYQKGKWEGPFILNKGYYAPTFSIDGKSLFFLGGSPDSSHDIVWTSRRSGDNWTAPERYLRKKYGLYDFMPTLSGICYVGSNAHTGNRNDFSTYDICTLKMSMQDTMIKSLGKPLNTSGFDGDFYVSPDESYIIISNKETKKFESELAISFKKKDMNWTKPISLGLLINDGLAHRWGQYVTPNGKYLFYTKGTSEKDCYLYWVRFDTLKEQLKKIALG